MVSYLLGDLSGSYEASWHFLLNLLCQIFKTHAPVPPSSEFFYELRRNFCMLVALVRQLQLSEPHGMLANAIVNQSSIEF